MKRSIIGLPALLVSVLLVLPEVDGATVPLPSVRKLTVEGGAAVGTLSIHLLADIRNGATQYRLWERGQTEPVSWTDLPVLTNGLYRLPFKLEPIGVGFGVKRIVYLRATGGLVESKLGAAGVALVVPAIKKLAIVGGPKVGQLDIQLLADIRFQATKYRLWEKGETEPTTWSDLPAPTNGLYPFSFSLKPVAAPFGVKRVIYLRAMNEIGESKLGAAGAALVVPLVSKLTVVGGPKVDRLDIQLLADIRYDATDYKIWEKGEVEPPDWTPLPALENGLYPLAFELEPIGGGFSTTRVVYVRAQNAMGPSKPRALPIPLLVPILVSVTPNQGPAGYAQEVFLRGKFFGESGAGSKVVVGGTSCDTIVEWTPTAIRCLVPATAPAGLADVVVVTANGLESKPRQYRFMPDWVGPWVGTYSVLENTEGCDDEAGWLIVSLTPTGADGIIVALADGNVLKGFFAGNTIEAQGRGVNGDKIALEATKAGDTITGIYYWTGKSGGYDWAGSASFALGRPGPRVDISGIYVLTPEEYCSSCGGQSIDTVNFTRFTQRGGDLAGTGLFLGESSRGAVEGNVFVVRTNDGVVSGIANLNQDGAVESLVGTARWRVSICQGWTAMAGKPSRGTAGGGVPDGLSLCWQIDVDSYAYGNLPTKATVTVKGNSITIVGVNQYEKTTFTGKIYDSIDKSSGGRFAAKSGSQYLFGFYDPAHNTCSGTYVDQDPYEPDWGTFSGTLYGVGPCP